MASQVSKTVLLPRLLSQASPPCSSSHKGQKLTSGETVPFRDLTSNYIAVELKGACFPQEIKLSSQPRNVTDKERGAYNVYFKVLLPSEPIYGES